MKKNFFLCYIKIYSNILFFLNFSIDFIPVFNSAKILILLMKSKISKTHRSVTFESKVFLKKNFFLRHIKIYSNIIFFRNFSKVFIPVFNLAKILICWWRAKFRRLIAPLVSKINYSWRGTFFFVTPISTQFPIFPNFSGILFPPWSK